MRRVIDLGKVLKIEMRIDLRGADAGVTEQFLHRTQIAGGLQQMAGKAVTEHVRMNMHTQSA